MIAKIVESEACSRCGLCVAACPEGAIELDDSCQPQVNENCTSCGICLEVCPRNEFCFSSIKDFVKKQNKPHNEEELLGPFCRILLGRSTDEEILDRAYSGGVTTTLLCYLLGKGEIDNALLTSCEHPKNQFCGHPIPFNAKTRDEIISCADTKPCVNPILAKLPADGDKSAIVGVPCHIQGIRKAMWLAEYGDKSKEICKRLTENIKYVIGLNCFFSFRKNGVDELLAKVNRQEEELSKFYNWKGKSVARLKDGSEIDDFGKMGDFSVANIGCLCCYPSYSAKLADITFGKCMSEEWGWNDIITRSEETDTIISEMEKEGLIKVKNVDMGKSELLEALLEANVFEVDSIGYGRYLDTGEFESAPPSGQMMLEQGKESSIKAVNRIRLIQAVKRDAFYKIVKSEREKRGIFNPLFQDK